MRGHPSGSQRVRSAHRRTVSSTRWLHRQLNDPYVAAAKAQGLRSRSAFKLEELDIRFRILRNAQAIIDLGCAPGGWCQVARTRQPKAKIIGLDILDMAPLEGVDFIKMDFLDSQAPEHLRALLGRPADLVLSDMAANTTGHKDTDYLRTMGLCEAALDFALHTLKPGGAFVAKVFAGGADAHMVAQMKTHFTTVKHAKPPASRKESREWYVVAQGFKAPSP